MDGAGEELLMRAKSDPDPIVRFHAATTLENIGKAAAKAIPTLAQALYDENDSVRLAAAYALETIEEVSQSE